MCDWDPIDSLIYLGKASPLDWVSELIQERFGDETENEDVADILTGIDSARSMIRAEVKRHYDGRTAYSTGVPFMRMYREPGVEPRPDGVDEIVMHEMWVSMRPDGHPREPLGGGVWADESSQ